MMTILIILGVILLTGAGATIIHLDNARAPRPKLSILALGLTGLGLLCFLVVIVAEFIQPSNAQAQWHFYRSMCWPAAEIAESLRTNFNEDLLIIGTASEGTEAIQIWVSPEGTFTVLHLDTDGMACAVATGEDWLQEGLVEAPGSDG